LVNEPAPGAPSRFADVVGHFQTWWLTQVAATVNQAEVIEKRRTECALSSRYLLMICMSAGIAILGLLQASPAVVIGAMLLSPLMDPIMGIGFALATGDFKWLKQSVRTLAIGVLFAVVFCTLVVMLSPLQTVTSEIAARTRPTLFDLGVALFSAVAGAYAMIRGREGTIVGVAIATALMPPLATVGFGIATLNATVFSGALGLFFTNLMTIALTATIMARLYGFRTSLSEKQSTYQTIIIVAAFVALAVPLMLSLRQIAWETNASRIIHSEVMDPFGARARLSQVETNFEASPIRVSATVLTPRIEAEAERIAGHALAQRLGRPVDLTLTQYRVGTSAQAAEEAQLVASQAREQAAGEQAEELANRLALIAGVSSEQVTVDRARRRATVTARPLDGATLATYFELERRLRAMSGEGWDIKLLPPALALPTIGFDDDQVSASGQRAIELAGWAAQRSTLPIRLEGPSDAVALARVALQEQGVSPQTETRGSGFGSVRVVWVAPQDDQ
jgi:uncharacterized hydrophobic protein (TIGR00271 family)